MPKLFVAVELPDTVTSELVRVQPPPVAGMRLAEPGQMHLTLHYLGEADIERMAVALTDVCVPAFPLAFDGVGHFPSAGGATTLWAGVRVGAELLALHTAVATALTRQGFLPEARPYTPHITLARCESGVAASVVLEFLAQHAKFSLEGVSATSYGLYSSEFVSGVPVYRREQSFSLPPAGKTWQTNRSHDQPT
ncbi:MAG: RNA 2',3'-cyclic phosphodiesterase [Planctomycetaceae bacterium]|nr:RNA 2',3'-cyclic phosphodiesterase [Planctomycetaceae bacterium]